MSSAGHRFHVIIRHLWANYFCWHVPGMIVLSYRDFSNYTNDSTRRYDTLKGLVGHRR